MLKALCMCTDRELEFGDEVLQKSMLSIIIMISNIYFFFSWYDGFSTFYVNDQGQIVKHVADKVKNIFFMSILYCTILHSR